MFFETKLSVDVKLPAPQSTKIVKFGKNLQFNFKRKHVDKWSCMLEVEDLKGDFKILKITEIKYDPKNSDKNAVFRQVSYDKNKISFLHYYESNNYRRTFYDFEILANIEYKEVNYVKDKYHLLYPSERLKMLGKYEFTRMEFVLPKYQDLKFICYFKKQEDGAVEIHIVNPYNLKIQGKKGDFKYRTNDQTDINYKLSFIFDPSTVFKYDEEKFEAVDSRPDSAMFEELLR